jgi:uncharacterized membrane protein
VTTDHAVDADHGLEAENGTGTGPAQAEPAERRRLTDLVGSPSRAYSLLITVGAALGLIASFTLTVDRIRLLKDANTQLACNFSSVVNCASVMSSPQGEAFGFANPIIGLAAFGGLLVLGAGLLGGASYARWMWGGLTLGTVFGISFVGWLADQAIFHIGRLCPWCMLVWAVMIPIFVATVLFTLSEVLPVPAAIRRVARFLRQWQGLCMLLLYAIVATAIATNNWGAS